MKIIHTSDWHLGHMLYGYDRSMEQNRMIDQMVDLVGSHRPDAFIVSGDIFHTSSPSNHAQSMLAEGLMRIRSASPATTIIVTAGNHDSGARLEVFRTPWKALGVHVVGQYYRDDLQQHIIEIDGKGFVIALPYINEFFITDGLYETLQNMVADRNKAGLPVVMMAHATVTGCDISWHSNSNEYSAGGINSQPLESFGNGYDYLALGHIHKPQRLSPKAFYCGTPLPIGFDEEGDHGALLVEIPKHGDTPTVTPLPIENPLPLKTLPEPDSCPAPQTWDNVRQLFEAFPDGDECYIRLNVKVDNSGFIPASAAQTAAHIAEKKQCRFCHINPIRETANNSTDNRQLNVDEFRQEKPIDILARYLHDKNIVFDNDMHEVFDEVLRNLNI